MARTLYRRGKAERSVPSSDEIMISHTATMSAMLGSSTLAPTRHQARYRGISNERHHAAHTHICARDLSLASGPPAMKAGPSLRNEVSKWRSASRYAFMASPTRA